MLRSSVNVAVLGGGISGLSVAYYLSKFCPQLSVKVLEASGRTGGVIRSSRNQGILFEQGARSIPASGSGMKVLELLTELGLGGEVIWSSKQNQTRYIFINGRLRKVPHSLSSGIRSRITLSVLRSLMRDSLVTPGRRADESVQSFISRHSSSPLLNASFEAFVIGTRAGKASDYSADAAFPLLRRLEADFGSLRRGLLHLRKQVRTERQGSFTLRGGLEGLCRALASRLADRILLKAKVLGLKRFGNGYLIQHSLGTVSADVVVSTLPAYAFAQIGADLAPLSSYMFASIPYAPLAVVSLGWREKLKLPSGFGYLVPPTDHQSILGASWNQQIFPAQYGAETSSITVNVGGEGFQNFSKSSPGDFINLARRELAYQCGISAEPEVEQCSIYYKALPQFRVGYAEQLERAKQSLPENLHLFGSFLGLVGVRDIVSEAQRFVAMHKDQLNTLGVESNLQYVENW